MHTVFILTRSYHIFMKYAEIEIFPFNQNLTQLIAVNFRTPSNKVVGRHVHNNQKLTWLIQLKKSFLDFCFLVHSAPFGLTATPRQRLLTPENRNSGHMTQSAKEKRFLILRHVAVTSDRRHPLRCNAAAHLMSIAYQARNACLACWKSIPV